jgi:hypothetical protein
VCVWGGGVSDEVKVDADAAHDMLDVQVDREKRMFANEK